MVGEWGGVGRCVPVAAGAKLAARAGELDSLALVQLLEADLVLLDHVLPLLLPLGTAAAGHATHSGHPAHTRHTAHTAHSAHEHLRQEVLEVDFAVHGAHAAVAGVEGSHSVAVVAVAVVLCGGVSAVG